MPKCIVHISRLKRIAHGRRKVYKSEGVSTNGMGIICPVWSRVVIAWDRMGGFDPTLPLGSYTHAAAFTVASTQLISFSYISWYIHVKSDICTILHKGSRLIVHPVQQIFNAKTKKIFMLVFVPLTKLLSHKFDRKKNAS